MGVCSTISAQEFYRCQGNKFLHIKGNGEFRDIPLGDDFKFSIIWDWQNKEASFQGMPFITGNIGGLERLSITRQKGDWFAIDRLWYRFTYSYNDFFFSGSNRNTLTIIVGHCQEYSVFAH